MKQEIRCSIKTEILSKSESRKCLKTVLDSDCRDEALLKTQVNFLGNLGGEVHS